MIVHFVGSRHNIAKGAPRLQLIVEAIKGAGHTLVTDWVDAATKEVNTTGIDEAEFDWKAIHDESLEAVNKADVVIADSTVRSFSVGYQVSTAVQMKKPTLVLRQEGITDSVFASGIDVGVVYKTCNQNNTKRIVQEFLKENDIPLKDMRFNFFIDRKIYNYLRWSSFKTGKTKAEILRDLVEKEIEKEL